MVDENKVKLEREAQVYKEEDQTTTWKIAVEYVGEKGRRGKDRRLDVLFG